jgi:thiol-disulfide isomerase/thioredoxin
MGIFDNIPQWAIYAGAAIIGAALLYLAWKYMGKSKKDKKHAKGEETEGGAPPPATGGTPSTPPQAGPPTLVLLRWDDCGHCKSFMPEWEKIKKAFAGKIQFEEHEQNKEPEVMKKYNNTTNFPTLYWKVGNKIEKYEGDRTLDAISKFISSK